MQLQGGLMLLNHKNNSKRKIEFIQPGSWRSKCGIKTGKGIKREALKMADIQFVKDKYNIDNINDDIADAICIGHSCLGAW